MTERSQRLPSGAIGSARNDQPTRSVRWIAHRGWSTRFPENSLAALAAAVSAGADEIEFDVRHTADGVPVVIHDPTVERITALGGAVSSLSVTELTSATIIRPDGSEFPNMGIATVVQVLDMFAAHVGMNIHVKELGHDDATLLMIQAAAVANPERHIYIAGAEDVLEAAVRVCPEVPRCCLSRQRDPAGLLKAALAFDCKGLQYRWNAFDADAVAEARSHGLFCNLFYADTGQDAVAAIAAGIDGVLTNDIGHVRGAVAG